MALTKQQHAKRYRLHRKVRNLGFSCNARKREVSVNPDIDVLPPPVKELQTIFRYNIQTSIQD